MGVFDNLNILEILKLGFPGLVFILCLFSYRLLSQEQKKAVPNNQVLKSIKCYMYVNILLAILTISAPLIEDNYLISNKLQRFNIKAIMSTTPLNSGKARVCSDAEYNGRYLLINDPITGKLIQVFTIGILPCNTGNRIELSEEDVIRLGWTDFSKNVTVEVVAAEPGQMYILNDGIRTEVI